MRLRIDLPLSCREIRRKAAAWRELVGSDPLIAATGRLRADDGEHVRADGSEVSEVGRKWLTVRLNGAIRRLDPMSCDPGFPCYLEFEEAA